MQSEERVENHSKITTEIQLENHLLANKLFDLVRIQQKY